MLKKKELSAGAGAVSGLTRINTIKSEVTDKSADSAIPKTREVIIVSRRNPLVHESHQAMLVANCHYVVQQQDDR